MKQASNRKARTDTPEYAQVRQRIIGNAIELLAEAGLQKFRFEALADKLDCNRATIYRYFDSKRELVNEVMLTLMHQITDDIVAATSEQEVVTPKSFAQSLHGIITQLRTDRRYRIVMDAGNVTTFAELTREHFSAVTTDMLQRHMQPDAHSNVLKAGVTLEQVVPWLIHQIISYGFFGLPGSTAAAQQAYLEKMVAPVIMQDPDSKND